MSINFSLDRKPTFIVVGAAKSGTTSAYHSLKTHPEVFVTDHKEPSYFSFPSVKPSFKGPFDEIINSEIVYKENEYINLYAESAGFPARGECSTCYIYHPEAAHNIASAIPDCRIVIILRDPVKRAYSHYLQGLMLGHENLSFENAIKAEEFRENASWRWHYQYLGQSRYAAQVRRYFDVFDSSQIKVIVFEELIQEYPKSMSEIYKHIGVQSDFESSIVKENQTGMPKNQFVHQFLRYPGKIKDITRPLMPSSWRAAASKYLEFRNYDVKANPKLDSALHENLNTQFSNDVNELSELLGREFPDWLKAPNRR